MVRQTKSCDSEKEEENRITMKLVYSIILGACLTFCSAERYRKRQAPVPPVVPPIRPPVVPPIRPVIPPVPRGLPVGVNPLNDVPILSYQNENNFDGSYKYSFETANGISVAEEGYLKNAGGPEDTEAQTAQGTYSYTAPDGQLITVTWVADENGFRASTGLGAGRVPPLPGAPRPPLVPPQPAPQRPVFGAPN